MYIPSALTRAYSWISVNIHGYPCIVMDIEDVPHDILKHSERLSMNIHGCSSTYIRGFSSMNLNGCCGYRG